MKTQHLLCLALLPLAASAIEPGPSSPQQAETEQWLTLQVNGHAASPTPQSSSPAEREQALQRWLDSIDPAVLNVAGPRASNDPRIYNAVFALLTSLRWPR